MSGYEENIYGNQEIVREHARGSKPIKVCRPDGLGQESPADTGEECFYVNKDAVAGDFYVPPTAKNDDRRPPVVQGSNYEVLNSNENKDLSHQRASGMPPNYNYRDQNQTKSFEGRFDQAAKKHPSNRTNTKVLDNSIELKDIKLDSNVALETTSSTPTTAQDKGKENATNRWPFFLGVIAILLSLIAIGLALLFGFRIIGATSTCECQNFNVDLLRKDVENLRKDVEQLKSKGVPSPSRSITTHIPSSLVLLSTVTSVKVQSTVLSEETSLSKGMPLSRRMTVAPTRSFDTSFYTQSEFLSKFYTGNSSRITNTTLVP